MDNCIKFKVADEFGDKYKTEVKKGCNNNLILKQEDYYHEKELSVLIDENSVKHLYNFIKYHYSVELL